MARLRNYFRFWAGNRARDIVLRGKRKTKSAWPSAPRRSPQSSGDHPRLTKFESRLSTFADVPQSPNCLLSLTRGCRLNPCDRRGFHLPQHFGPWGL